MIPLSADPTSATDVARLPIIIAEWDRNSREIVRLSLDRYNGRDTIDIRCWWRDTDGTLKPGRGGLTVAVHHLLLLLPPDSPTRSVGHGYSV